ncbi:hypothetical protein C7M84_015403 [Penaeus vannamei]|uniref:Uncharacterized protein n=1 Tax=Penaeus vannamei TaxID=6689 RepID=A0A3R7QGF8_PENVA|nr:hypothetical protein C7M84_015403 [Penaeus vannamei]
MDAAPVSPKSDTSLSAKSDVSSKDVSKKLTDKVPLSPKSDASLKSDTDKSDMLTTKGKVKAEMPSESVKVTQPYLDSGVSEEPVYAMLKAERAEIVTVSPDTTPGSTPLSPTSREVGAPFPVTSSFTTAAVQREKSDVMTSSIYEETTATFTEDITDAMATSVHGGFDIMTSSMYEPSEDLMSSSMYGEDFITHGVLDEDTKYTLQESTVALTKTDKPGDMMSASMYGTLAGDDLQKSTDETLPSVSRSKTQLDDQKSTPYTESPRSDLSSDAHHMPSMSPRSDGYEAELSGQFEGRDEDQPPASPRSDISSISDIVRREQKHPVTEKSMMETSMVVMDSGRSMSPKSDTTSIVSAEPAEMVRTYDEPSDSETVSTKTVIRRTIVSGEPTETVETIDEPSETESITKRIVRTVVTEGDPTEYTETYEEPTDSETITTRRIVRRVIVHEGEPVETVESFEEPDSDTVTTKIIKTIDGVEPSEMEEVYDEPTDSKTVTTRRIVKRTIISGGEPTESIETVEEPSETTTRTIIRRTIVSGGEPTETVETVEEPSESASVTRTTIKRTIISGSEPSETVETMEEPSESGTVTKRTIIRRTIVSGGEPVETVETVEGPSESESVTRTTVKRTIISGSEPSETVETMEEPSESGTVTKRTIISGEPVETVETVDLRNLNLLQEPL